MFARNGSEHVRGGAGVRRLMGAVGLAVGLVACEREQAAPFQMPPSEVATIEVVPERVALTRELAGRASAFLVAEVRPQTGGLILERLFEEGADVTEGQVLYQLDDREHQATLARALANLEAAESAVRQARAELEVGLAAVEQQEALVELAEVNRKRSEALASEGAESLSQRDRQATEARVAEANLRAARAAANRTRQAIEVSEAGAMQAKAAVDAARIDLSYTRITAPIAGRIGKSNVTVGSLVTARQNEPLATIQQLDPIYVDVPQSYGDLLRLRHRLEQNGLDDVDESTRHGRLLLEDGYEYPHEGDFQFRDVTVERSTDSVMVRLVFPNPDGVLLPGMFVRAVLTDWVNPAGILVPQQAILRDTKARPIAMLVKDGVVEQRSVELDRAIDNRWVVSSGLAAGDQVIVEGLQRVRHGATVRVVPFAP